MTALALLALACLSICEFASGTRTTSIKQIIASKRTRAAVIGHSLLCSRLPAAIGVETEVSPVAIFDMPAFNLPTDPGALVRVSRPFFRVVQAVR